MAGRLDMQTLGSGPNSGSPEIDAAGGVRHVSTLATYMTPDSAIAASTRPRMIIFSIENGCADEYLGDLEPEFYSITQKKKTACTHHTLWEKHVAINLWRL